MRRPVHTVFVGLVVFLVSMPALADTHRAHDPRDFREGIDIRTIVERHGAEHRVLQHAIRSYKRWRGAALRRGQMQIAFDFSTDDRRDLERQVRVRRRSGEIRAHMFGGKHLDKQIPGRIGIWRRDRRSLRISFQARLLGKHIHSYRWRAEVDFTPCPLDRRCIDFAPDDGFLRHRV